MTDEPAEGTAPGDLSESERRMISRRLSHPDAKTTVFRRARDGQPDVFGVASRDGRYVVGFPDEARAHAVARQWAIDMGGIGELRSGTPRPGHEQHTVWEDGLPGPHRLVVASILLVPPSTEVGP
jgi:hypothetical protein